jgi:hypothetical protein
VFFYPVSRAVCPGRTLVLCASHGKFIPGYATCQRWPELARDTLTQNFDLPRSPVFVILGLWQNSKTPETAIRKGFMFRKCALVCSVLVIDLCASAVDAQQLVNRGVLVTQILARTRMETCEKGELVHLTVQQPAGNKGMTVSVHAQYRDSAGKWQPVPPPNSPIGPFYTSKTYGGLRDWVEVNGVTETTDRNVTMFIPYRGFALPPGKDYDFRYVVRLWDAADKETGSVALEPYRIHVSSDADGPVVAIVDAKPCSFLAGSSPAEGPHGAGPIRFFDTATGKWICPEDKPSTAQR